LAFQTFWLANPESGIMTSGRTSAFEHWKKQARAIPIMDEIVRRGVTLKREGNEFIGPCPLCHGHDRFAVNIKKEVWNCRGCKVGGDVIDLVQHLDGVEFIEACTTLAGPPPQNGRDQTAAVEPRRVCVATYDYHDEDAHCCSRSSATNIEIQMVLLFLKTTASARRPFAKSGRIPITRANGSAISMVFGLCRTSCPN
jgi:phage/plasmid primase-like uncharacterized protein